MRCDLPSEFKLNLRHLTLSHLTLKAVYRAFLSVIQLFQTTQWYHHLLHFLQRLFLARGEVTAVRMQLQLGGAKDYKFKRKEQRGGVELKNEAMFPLTSSSLYVGLTAWCFNASHMLICRYDPYYCTSLTYDNLACFASDEHFASWVALWVM